MTSVSDHPFSLQFTTGSWMCSQGFKFLGKKCTSLLDYLPGKTSLSIEFYINLHISFRYKFCCIHKRMQEHFPLADPYLLYVYGRLWQCFQMYIQSFTPDRCNVIQVNRPTQVLNIKHILYTISCCLEALEFKLLRTRTVCVLCCVLLQGHISRYP